MISNLEKYKNDLQKLLDAGESLFVAMAVQLCDVSQEYKNEDFVKKLPSFTKDYQKWYSESLVLIKQLLPDRLLDFKSFYERPKNRKDISCKNYVIEDALISLEISKGDFERVIVSPKSAIPRLEQQIAILKSVENRFESSLFDIKQMVQADLFDSELDAAQHLNKKGFTRGAGAIAGVALEKHLLQVCENHNIAVKKNPTISDLNDLLKKNAAIEIPQWRNIQYLADLRNLCDHSKNDDPTKDQIDELIQGTSKITKTIF